MSAMQSTTACELDGSMWVEKISLSLVMLVTVIFWCFKISKMLNSYFSIFPLPSRGRPKGYKSITYRTNESKRSTTRRIRTRGLSQKAWKVIVMARHEVFVMARNEFKEIENKDFAFFVFERT